MINPFRTHRKYQTRKAGDFTRLSLNELIAGQSGIVVDISGDKELVNRIVSLGFTVGAQVTVLNNQRQGPILVSILGAHFALGCHEADLIRIQPV